MATDRHLTLDVAIITHSPEGILRVASMHLPAVDNVNYIVSWQDHRNTPIPQSLIRDDVKIHRLDKTGLSNNRNNAFCHSKGDLILCGDDDVIYTAKGLNAVIDTFDTHPDIDVATFMSRQAGAARSYPDRECQLTTPLPRNYSVCSIEIALRRSTAGQLRCHPELGLGSPSMHGGEDEVLLLSAIRRGLVCRYFPITVCEHPNLSTGNKKSLSDKNLRAMGCVIALYYPYSWVLRIPLKAWRVKKSRQAGFFPALRYLCQGVLKAYSLRPDSKYLW